MGWPRLCISVHAHDWFGREIVVGIGTCLIPVTQSSRNTVEIPLLTPKPSSIWTGLMGFITGNRPVIVDPDKFFLNSWPEKSQIHMQPAGGSISVILETKIFGAENSGFRFN